MDEEARRDGATASWEGPIEDALRSAMHLSAPPLDVALPEALAQRAVAGSREPVSPSVRLFRKTLVFVAVLGLGVFAVGLGVSLTGGGTKPGQERAVIAPPGQMNPEWSHVWFDAPAWERAGYVRVAAVRDLEERTGTLVPLPTEILGRAALGLFYRHLPASGDGREASAQLVAVYQDRMVIRSADARGRTEVSREDAAAEGAGYLRVEGVPMLARDPSGGARAAARADAGDDADEQDRWRPGLVAWIQDGREWRIYGEPSAADLLKVARSMLAAGEAREGGG